MKRLNVFLIFLPIIILTLAFTNNMPDDNTRGKEIFTANKCGTCHAIESAGITSKGKGPDLSKLGDTLKTEWVMKYLKKEDTKKGKSHPSAFKGSEDDLKTLSMWVVSLNSGTKSDKKDTQKDQSNNELMKSMDKMHKQMMGTKISGNADRDFAHLMIHHHEGAIDMAKHELANGNDQKVKDFARESSEKQQSDINKLKEFDNLKKISDANKNTKDKDMASHHNDMDMNDSLKAGNRDGTANTDIERTTDVIGSSTTTNWHQDMVKSMMDKVNNTEMTGNTDQDFVTMMIAHHQTAIDMTEQYSDKIQDHKLKEIAETIIESSKKEIDKLKTLKK